MGGINVSRWLLGGVVAAAVIWLIEGAVSVLYMDDMQAALQAHGLAMEMTGGLMVGTVVLSLLVGLALIFFYAAARPRFGPGPKTAVLVAVPLWAAGYVPTLVGYCWMGLYPNQMLVLWGGIGLVELILAALIGGWLYREGSAGPVL